MDVLLSPYDDKQVIVPEHALNINIIYDYELDEHIFIVHTQDNDLYLIKAKNKLNVRRIIHDEEANKHPFMQAVDGGQVGLKQLSKHFSNLFISHYRKGETSDWCRLLVYIEDGKSFVHDC